MSHVNVETMEEGHTREEARRRRRNPKKDWRVR